MAPARAEIGDPQWPLALENAQALDFGPQLRLRPGVKDVEVEAAKRVGLLQDVMSVLSEHKTNATSVTARTKRDGSASISCSLEIRDLNHLSQLLGKLNRVRDVRTAYRVTKREARAGDR